MQLGVKEVALYINLSVKTVYNLVYSNKIPFERLSRKKVVFYKEDIDAWLEKRKEGTQEVEWENREKREKRIALKLEPEFPTGDEKAAEPEKTAKDRKVQSPQTESSKPFFRRLVLSNFIVLACFLIIVWLGRKAFFGRPQGQTPAEGKSPHITDTIDIDTLLSKAEIGDIQIEPAGLDKNLVDIGVRLKNKASSAPIQSLLVGILKNQHGDYATRSKAIDILGPYLANDEIRNALISTIESDSNPVIRMKAASVLEKIAKMKDVKRALLKILQEDDNESIRFRALEILESTVDAEIINVIRNVRTEEKSEIIKRRADLVLKKYAN